MKNMNTLVTKIKWPLEESFENQMFVYGEASVEANKEMQEPLEKLCQYENMPDMRKKIGEYIEELDAEIVRLESDLEKQMTYNVEACKATATESRLQTLTEVKNDLLKRV